MAAVGRTLSKISGTDSGERQEDAAAAPQTFDQPYAYEDPNYVEPVEQAP